MQKNLTLSLHEYWVRGIAPHYSQSFSLGETAHGVGVDYCYVSEFSHELHYTSPISSEKMPTSNSPYDRNTQSSTQAQAWYINKPY